MLWRVPASEIYLVFVNSPSLSPDELRAAAEIHSELGPAYRDAVIDSFLDNVGKEIDARVDARLAGPAPTLAPAPARAKDTTFPLAVISIVLGIPITAIVLSAGAHTAGLSGLLIVWVAIVAINVASALHNRPR
jgi:hypothetical protein